MRMTKKNATIPLAGTAALVAVVALWPTAAVADRDGPSHGEVLEGHFVSERVEETFVDHDGDTLPSLGDEHIYTNTSTGTFGDFTEYGLCVLHEVDLSADSATANCTQTSESAKGTLTWQGTVRVGLTTSGLLEPAEWVITGGAGEFLGADGVAHLTRSEGAGLNFRVFGTVRMVLDR